MEAFESHGKLNIRVLGSIGYLRIREVFLYRVEMIIFTLNPDPTGNKKLWAILQILPTL